MKKRSRKEGEPVGIGVRVLVALVALGGIAGGVWIAATEVWADHGQVYAEGPLARVVGVAVAAAGALALLRVAQPSKGRR
jgi:hypothetical protein